MFCPFDICYAIQIPDSGLKVIWISYPCWLPITYSIRLYDKIFLYNLYQLHSSVFESLRKWDFKMFSLAICFIFFWQLLLFFTLCRWLTHGWCISEKKRVTLDQTRRLYWRRSIEEVKIFNTVLLQKQDQSNFDTR